MKTIELTQGQVAKVSDHRFEYLNQWKWYAQWSKKEQSYYAVRHEKEKVVSMHREIAGTQKGMICDHIDHDTLNCQDYNLRNVTQSENLMNRRAFLNNKIGERNILLHYGGFRVCVKAGGKRVFDKTFRTLEDAIVARDEAIHKYHGEYAYSSEQDSRLR